MYVATVARTYRKAFGDFNRDPALYEQNLPWYREEIGKCTYRAFTTGFFYGKPTEADQIYDSNTYIKNYVYLGMAEEPAKEALPARTIRLEQRNKFSVGEMLEIMKPDGRNVPAKVLEIRNEEGEQMESAPHPKQVLYVTLSEEAMPYDILRRKAD